MLTARLRRHAKVETVQPGVSAPGLATPAITVRGENITIDFSGERRFDIRKGGA